ncbi:MAG: hypothetical protein ABSG43_30940, partial [Solirubrobacteraceae bacterium]
ALPAISGTATQGQTLTASNSTWSDSSATFSYQWQDCDGSGSNCVNIDDATSSTYTVGTGDLDHTVVVVVTATNLGGSTPSSSQQSAVVAPPAPSNTAAPSISGSCATSVRALFSGVTA